jgi:hypothetical protein
MTTPMLVALRLVLACCLLLSAAHAQQDRHLTAWDFLRDQLDGPVDSANSIAQFVHLDFAHLLQRHQQHRLGFIGKDFQRFRIYFSSISKDPADPSLYHVRGKTKVREVICDVVGKMRLQWIRRLHQPDVCENSIRPAVQGISFFSYEFNEDSTQRHSGYFRGTATVQWYVDAQNTLAYDQTWSCSDFYGNNFFAGTWTSYTTNDSKPCNWGNARIPFSDQLDVGVGEFSPDPAYASKGWHDFGRESRAPWWR